MRSLSGTLSAALGAPVQRPAVLVEAQLTVTQRWSSMSTFSWNSQTWTGRDLAVENLQVSALRVSGSIVLGNADDVAGTLVLGESIQDKVIRIWGFDAAATGASDIVWLCDAVGAGATVTPQRVTINLRHKCEYVAVPRTLVLPVNGFNQLLPAGTVLTIAGTHYTLER